MTNTTIERALIARGRNGTCVVLASDTPCIRADCESINDHCDDIGIDTQFIPQEAGLYLWEGTGEYHPQEPFPNGICEAYVEYTGRARRVAITDEAASAVFAECVRLDEADEPVEEQS